MADASMEATRLTLAMNIPTDRPVDVFLLAQRLRLWLAAQPLDSAYGFYLRQGDVAGIVVNSRHPESLQRYTCAHEIGHHILGHASHVDDASTLRQYSNLAMQEMQAQVFAASLLMPLPLVNRVLAAFGAKHLGPAEVYLFSREVGVSYSAAAWQLTQYQKLSRAEASALVKRGAAAAKTELLGMTRASDARADLWILGPSSNGVSIVCRIEDELHVRLPEDLSLGRVWTIDEPNYQQADDSQEPIADLLWDGDEGLTVLNAESDRGTSTERAVRDIDVVYNAHLGVESSFTDEDSLSGLPYDGDMTNEGNNADLPGPGRRAITFIPRSPGAYSVKLSLRSAWDRSAPAAETVSFTVRVAEHDRLVGAGYATPQIGHYAARIAAA